MTTFIASNEVTQLLESYPAKAQEKLKALRQLIIDCATEIGDITRLEETTKWNEPSYICPHGSTIRMDWKAKTPDAYYLFFICNTELVNTFRFIFGDELQFEGKRAIVLDLHAAIPTKKLKRCIKLALTYKKIKHLPHLGA